MSLMMPRILSLTGSPCRHRGSLAPSRRSTARTSASRCRRFTIRATGSIEMLVLIRKEPQGSGGLAYVLAALSTS